MATTTEPVDAPPSPPEGPTDDPSTRRLLRALLVLLGLVAVALLALLIWLLRPGDSGAGPSGPPGYPIEVVTTIYGYGDAPEEQMSQPLGVAWDADGNLWTSNSGQARVDVYTRDGEYIRSVGDEEGEGRLYAPYGIAVDFGRGIVYVADPGSGSIQMYTTDGASAGKMPAEDQKDGVFGPDGFAPYDVEVAPDGRIIVSSADGLYYFDQEGHVVARWGATVNGENFRGSGPGMFNFPNSFTVDTETGWIYVADTLNKRVIAIDQDGFWKWVSGIPDQEGKSFWQLPRGTELGPDGNLYVVDTFRFDEEGMGTGHIVVLSRDGDLLSEFGRSGSEDGAFSFPDQLASGPDGLWSIADRENNRVVVFRLITPYPEVDDLLADRYPKTFDEPEFTWVTPPPTPPVDLDEG